MFSKIMYKFIQKVMHFQLQMLLKLIKQVKLLLKLIAFKLMHLNCFANKAVYKISRF